MKATDRIIDIKLKRFDVWGQLTNHVENQKSIRISICFNNKEDNYHIEFKPDVERAHISYLLRDLADLIEGRKK